MAYIYPWAFELLTAIFSNEEAKLKIFGQILKIEKFLREIIRFLNKSEASPKMFQATELVNALVKCVSEDEVSQNLMQSILELNFPYLLVENAKLDNTNGPDLRLESSSALFTIIQNCQESQLDIFLSESIMDFIIEILKEESQHHTSVLLSQALKAIRHLLTPSTNFCLEARLWFEERQGRDYVDTLSLSPNMKIQEDCLKILELFSQEMDD